MKSSFIRYLLASVLILIGAALVLANVGIIDFNINNAWIYIYPILFILVGIKWMVDKIRYKGGSWIFGSFFFIFGTLLLLDRFQVINFTFWDVLKLWPLLIVYIGFSFAGHSKGREKVFVGTDKAGKTKTFNGNNFFSIGDQEFNQPNWKVEPMDLKSMAGDFYLDFSKAFIPGKETPITVNGMAGDVHILMPENVEFRIDASVKAGDIDVLGQIMDGINRRTTFETANYDTAARKINFSIKLKAGSIRVVKV